MVGLGVTVGTAVDVAVGGGVAVLLPSGWPGVAASPEVDVTVGGKEVAVRVADGCGVGWSICVGEATRAAAAVGIGVGKYSGCGINLR